ncbi:ABC transporter substrate-binding protein [Variovorax sp. J22P168]|uniref:ABC transporter substrate-binding protein n=1 Tax=Variovorax jilinensis TaxID=3053513 RepID=UPI002576953B|nr:ABC transporter substrate-binding protein [Variovorax sp. J22P168]MDM0014923.1 ABC transporter substrate-binding protein [Variovorax sp. J22P168]
MRRHFLLKASASFASIMFSGLFLAGPAHAQSAPPLNIGLLLSLSGPAAPFGIPERDAVQAVAAKINAEGGVGGRQIVLSIYDDGTNPTEAARGATQLIQKDKVVAIIGSTTGSGTLAAAPVAMRNEVPILAPNGTLSVTSKDNKFYPWVFRSLTGDLTNTDVLVKRAAEAGAKRIGIFYQEDAYGKNTADYMQEVAKRYGLEIAGVAAAPLNSTDLSPQAARIRNANPDAVLVQASAPALGAAFVRAAKQIDMKAQLWAPVGLGQRAFIDASGAAGNGVKLVVLANWDDPIPQLVPLGTLLKAAGKSPQGFGELIGANAILAIVEAAKKVRGEITGKALRDQLEVLCGLESYTAGKACYSADNHDGWSADFLTTVEIRDGKFITLK